MPQTVRITAHLNKGDVLPSDPMPIEEATPYGGVEGIIEQFSRLVQSDTGHLNIVSGNTTYVVAVRRVKFLAVTVDD